LIKKLAVYVLHLSFALTLVGCAQVETKQPVAVKAAVAKKPCNCVCTQAIAPVVPAVPVESCQADAAVKAIEAKIPQYGLLKAASWDEVEGLSDANLGEAWPAWMQSCSALANKPMWQSACAAASELNAQLSSKTSAEKTSAVTAYFQQHFSVYKTTNIDGTDSGTITGYYEPVLKGSRTKSAAYPYPLYLPPLDMVTVELASLFPELKYKRVRGRLIGNKLVPYYDRAEIEADISPISGREFIYIDDIIDVFFLQIQGSGLVQLDSGERVHVGYADQNGQSYHSIGRLLIERGELTASNASMQGIKNWARNNLSQLRELLNSNPSYVFFRELPAGLPGPLGALGVPILAESVVAVDPKFVPLGAPVFLSTTQPNSTKPLQRMVMAQDTGGAIKGGVRADFFWGAGLEAGAKAGSMKQSGKIWVFLPKQFTFKQAQ
jgi:membrane-bound lytic murein transglycosylase A